MLANMKLDDGIQNLIGISWDYDEVPWEIMDFWTNWGTILPRLPRDDYLTMVLIYGKKQMDIKDALWTKHHFFDDNNYYRSVLWSKHH